MIAAACGIVMLCAASAAAEVPIEYRVQLDPGLGMESGVTNLTTIGRLALRGTDALTHRVDGIVVRLAAGIAVDSAIAISAAVLPHEVFGHGARAREFGFEVHYELRPPPPYAWLVGGGLRSSTRWELADRVASTADETALFHLGGLEAQEVQLRSLALTAFRARTLSRGDALLYLTGALETLTYVARDDGDVALFYDHLRARYGEDERSSRRATGLSAVLAVADPLFVFSLYGYFYRYLGRGDRALPYPTLAVGGADLALTNRLLLVPWGREHQLTALIGTRAATAAVTIGIGEGPGGSSASLSLDVADVPLGRGLFAVGQLQLAA
ncbi:MAG: hypothetical protein H0V17_21730, partial [Deltaproteobacteria bacterium]|nr:hypothetical protein [Deltaproteobacteria bacterium]